MHTNRSISIWLKDLIMKSLLIALTGVLVIGATLPAVAGPDWQLIEQGRKAKLVRMQQAAAAQGPTSGSSTTDQEAHTKQMMKECAEMMKK
ncbi:hypothetical protein EGT07_23580 [Herbaspirillum sp. HC18]|nr:hypothetical protein EGT07_23580 [Herbaspirillum sp. HC18]